MFTLFSRKQQPAASVTNAQSGAMAVDSGHRQLRTPSPSEAAFNGLAPGTMTSLAASGSGIQKPAVPPTPEALRALIASIPPKTLHAYVLAHIPDTHPDTLFALASFFATLSPPPLLHCVRCHADYIEDENSDRSCRVPHDDDSTNVEWVGLTRGGSEYETYWECCDKTVEGEGDLGPPDGWCYEGMHTVDTRRARFRADSTPTDDMLVTCLELNCHNIRAQLTSAKPTATGRTKRARPPPDEDNLGDDDVPSEGTEDIGIAEIAHGIGTLGRKEKGKAKAWPKPKTATAAAAAAPKPARARVARVRMQMPRKPESDSGSSKAESAPAPPPAPSTRRKRRPDAKPRSAASLSSASKGPPAAASPPSSPQPRGRKPPSSVSKMDSVEIVLRSRSVTRPRVRGGDEKTGDEKTMTDTEGKVRKRRKVASA